MACGSRRHKTCHDRSCQRYYNTTAQPLVAGQALQLAIAGSRVVDTGVAIQTEPNNYTTNKTGLYHFSADVVLEASAAGDVIFQMYMDGIPLPCTLREVNAVATSIREIHTETDLFLEGCCCDVTHNFTFILTSVDTAAGNVVHFCSGIVKMQ